MIKTKKKPVIRTFEQKLALVKKDIFEAAFDPDICGFSTINELATEAGLCWQTVDRFYQRGGTKDPRFRTLYKLAKAVKMDIALMKEALR